jgi:hypothetical protein
MTRMFLLSKGDTSAGSQQIASNPQIKGNIYAGQVTDNGNGDLTVEAFDAIGTSLGKAKVNKDGSYELTLTKSYKGMLVLKVYDANTSNTNTPQHLDEATNQSKPLPTLLASVDFTGTTTTINITPLTHMAAFKSGISVDDKLSSKISTSYTLNDNDTFVWNAGDAVGNSVDIIKDFSVWNGTTGDKLDIKNLLTGYTSGTSDLNKWVTFIINNSTVDKPSGVSSTNTKIVIDIDGAGSGTTTQTIWLDGVSGLSNDPTTLKNNGILIA